MLAVVAATAGALSVAALTLITLVLGALVTAWSHATLSSPHHASRQPLHRLERELQVLRDLCKEGEQCSATPARLPVILGRTVDTQLQQLLDLVLRDLVSAVLTEHTHDPASVIALFKQHVWGALQIVEERLSRVDADKLIACDMVSRLTAHFEKIRIAQSCAMELNQRPVFALSSHLTTAESELHYLRQTSELLIIFLLPRTYSLPPASHFLKELLACRVLQPAIDLITDPDYINQKVLEYLEAQKEVDAMHVKTHEYAKTFEDYIRLINSCNSVDTLKRLRYDIVAQIMHATTLQNVKRARGIDVDAPERGGGGGQHNMSRQQMSAARNLKRYISQLTFAKAECETALRRLGWEGAFPTVESGSFKSMPVESVLQSVAGRKQLSLFLETLCSQGLVGFWLAVEELRQSSSSSQHQLGAEIFYTYIRSPSAELKVDKETRKRMESFLLGDSGPEVFYEVQDQIVDTIRDKYYSPFLLSENYKALLKELATEANSKEMMEERSPLEERQLSNESASSAESAGGGVDAHSTYARRKLDQLQERHNNKTQALAALRASLKPESKALSLLAGEVERLAGERRRLEAHLARTDTWAEHLGRWRATVHSAEVVEESKPVQFVVVVHMAQESEEAERQHGEERPEAITTGWVLLRTLPQFQELHRKLRPLCAELKNIELPSNSSFKFLFGKNDKASLEKAKILIQKYLEFVLEDERLNQSEALYAFLNPSSEHLKHPNDHMPKKPRFSFSTLFKSTSSEATSRSSQEREPCLRESADEDEMSLYLDGENSETAVKNCNSAGRGGGGGGTGGGGEERDGIAEPLYALLSEVFDMRGVFKWLRRTLITFVQITYGRTINRQIRDTISWILSEQMLHYYVSLVIKSWWPGGVFCKPPPPRTQQEKDELRETARHQVTAQVTETFASLVGAAAAERGASKLFHAFQSTKHNKQLFYELFELVLVEVFPELKKHQYI